MLESGSLMFPTQIRERYYPDLFPNPGLTQLDKEFGYRMDYLRLHGVVTLIPGGEVGITSLGFAFLAEARRRRDYQEQLFLP